MFPVLKESKVVVTNLCFCDHGLWFVFILALRLFQLSTPEFLNSSYTAWGFNAQLNCRLTGGYSSQTCSPVQSALRTQKSYAL